MNIVCLFLQVHLVLILCSPGCQLTRQSKCGIFSLGLLILCLVAAVCVCVGSGVHLSPSSWKVSGFNGDTIVCDQPNGIWTQHDQVSECGDYNGYRVDTYVVEGQLETYQQINEMFDVAQPAAVGRFNIPINVDRVPYLFEHSTVTMSICFRSTNATTSPVEVLVFDDLDKRKRFTEGKVDSEMSVYQQQLPVGSHSQMLCSDVVYRVTHPGYYCIALDSPSGVTFMDNLTENVISVNSSEYQADCTVGKSDPCPIDIPFNPSVHILCHIPKNDPHVPSPQSTSMCSSRLPRYTWIIVAGTVMVILICAMFITVCVWFIVWCWRKFHVRRQRQEYSPIN